MRALYSILTGLFLTLFLTSCKSKEKGKDQLTLVYIDLSYSQDTESMEGMLKKIETVFMSQSKEVDNRFVVRVVDKDNSTQSIFDHTIEQLSSERGIKEQQFREEKQNQASRLRDTIVYYFKNINFKKPRCKESCICNSLENAHLLLNSIDTAKWEVKMIVLSDMFEECSGGSSYFDVDFYMCKNGRNPSDFNDLKAKIANNYAPKHLLSKYVKPENLYFIFTESDLYNEPPKCLDPNEVEELWKEILKKMGYSDPDFGNSRGITYSNELPEKLLNR